MLNPIVDGPTIFKDKDHTTMSSEQNNTTNTPDPHQELGPTPYERIGGEEGVRKLVDHFYDVMDQAPEALVVRQMHAKSLRVSRDKLFMFLSGWLGGPQLYIEQYGHPRLRMRHFPFEIDQAAAEQWMFCMRQAIAQTVEDEDLASFLNSALARVAHHMRNKEG